MEVASFFVRRLIKIKYILYIYHTKQVLITKSLMLSTNLPLGNYQYDLKIMVSTLINKN